MTKDHRNFAVKICEIKRAQPRFLKQSTHDPQAEAIMLRNLNHPHIVKVFDFVNDVDNRKLYIVMELLTAGTIERLTALDLKRKAFGQLLTAVEYIHNQRLAHRDLKLENVMLDSNGKVRLCDFGIAIHVPPGSDLIQTEMKGTPAYLSPEILNTTNYNPFKADVWALGVTLFHLIFAVLPFPSENMLEQERLIAECDPRFPEGADPQLVDLLSKILVKNPQERITIEEIWGHPWMIGIKPSLIHLMLRVKELCQMMAKVDATTAITVVRRGERPPSTRGDRNSRRVRVSRGSKPPLT
jgi:serine/threonine protein kinase